MILKKSANKLLTYSSQTFYLSKATAYTHLYKKSKLV
jgi:hypothetical protein